MNYEQLIIEARKLLCEAIEARRQGGLHGDKQQRSAYADGYLRALRDAGLASDRELLELVADARRAVDGPAVEQRIAAAS